MFVKISHPVWHLGIPKRARLSQFVQIAAESMVEIAETKPEDTEVAFRIDVQGEPLDLRVLKGASPGDGVWWPIRQRDGRPLRAQDWAAAMAAPSADLKAESGFASVLAARHGGVRIEEEHGRDWPSVARMRSTEKTFEGECRTLVSRAAEDLMVCSGVVWRRMSDPLYCVSKTPRSQNSKIELPAISSIEQHIDKEMHFVRTVGKRGVSAAAEEIVQHGTMAIDYFRADDRDAAVDCAANFAPNGQHADRWPTIHVIKPDFVTSTPSLTRLKWTAESCMRDVEILADGRKSRAAAIMGRIKAGLDAGVPLQNMIDDLESLALAADEEFKGVFVRPFLKRTNAVVERGALLEKACRIMEHGHERGITSPEDFAQAVADVRRDMKLGRVSETMEPADDAVIAGFAAMG